MGGNAPATDHTKGKLRFRCASDHRHLLTFVLFHIPADNKCPPHSPSVSLQARPLRCSPSHAVRPPLLSRPTHPVPTTQARCILPSSAKHTVWQIELHNGADSRLTRDLVEGALKPALDIVEREWRAGWRAAVASKAKDEGAGALVIVGNRAQDKFFSNGEFLHAV